MQIRPVDVKPHYNKTYIHKDITQLVDIINGNAKFWHELLTVCTKSYLTKDRQINNKLEKYFERAIEKDKHLYWELEKYIIHS